MSGERLRIREDILKILTSDEAERTSRYLSLLYLRLLRAPRHLWPREGVLHLVGELREGQMISAWKQLISLVKASPRTARKVLTFLESHDVINIYIADDMSEIIINFKGLIEP